MQTGFIKKGNVLVHVAEKSKYGFDFNSRILVFLCSHLSLSLALSGSLSFSPSLSLPSLRSLPSLSLLTLSLSHSLSLSLFLVFAPLCMVLFSDRLSPDEGKTATIYSRLISYELNLPRKKRLLISH